MTAGLIGRRCASGRRQRLASVTSSVVGRAQPARQYATARTMVARYTGPGAVAIIGAWKIGATGSGRSAAFMHRCMARGRVSGQGLVPAFAGLIVPSAAGTVGCAGVAPRVARFRVWRVRTGSADTAPVAPPETNGRLLTDIRIVYQCFVLVSPVGFEPTTPRLKEGRFYSPASRGFATPSGARQGSHGLPVAGLLCQNQKSGPEGNAPPGPPLLLCQLGPGLLGDKLLQCPQRQFRPFLQAELPAVDPARCLPEVPGVGVGERIEPGALEEPGSGL